MRTSDFDYALPEDLIAQSPLEDRAASRLLHLHRRSGTVDHRRFSDIVEILQPEDLLVMNDTKVTSRRIQGARSTGGRVELLVLREVAGGYEALTRPAKKLRAGDEVTIDGGGIAVIRGEGGGGVKIVDFSDDVDMAHVGSVPLPPYIQQALLDEGRYQTVYAEKPGSAAAPTAGLHFTADILRDLRSNGVRTAFVNLSVGLDTFRPVNVEDVEQHQIHGEVCSVPEETAEAIRACRGRIIAVGTTTTRTLETMARGPREVEAGATESRLFVSPGYEFRVIDGMLTNFHMPRTTMMFMIGALAGRGPLLDAYGEAVRLRYRFLSFGDSMLVL